MRRLAPTESGTSRVWVMLESSRVFRLKGGAAFVPTLEAGPRQDGGNAETGTGVEIGGGARYATQYSPIPRECVAVTAPGIRD